MEVNRRIQLTKLLILCDRKNKKSGLYSTFCSAQSRKVKPCHMLVSKCSAVNFALSSSPMLGHKVENRLLSFLNLSTLPH